MMGLAIAPTKKIRNRKSPGKKKKRMSKKGKKHDFRSIIICSKEHYSTNRIDYSFSLRIDLIEKMVQRYGLIL